MELFNEATTILIVDCFVIFTDVVNDGNVNDGNAGNTPDLERSRNGIAYLYIALFMGNVAFHLGRLFVTTCKRQKAVCSKKYRQRRQKNMVVPIESVEEESHVQKKSHFKRKRNESQAQSLLLSSPRLEVSMPIDKTSDVPSCLSDQINEELDEAEFREEGEYIQDNELNEQMEKGM